MPLYTRAGVPPVIPMPPKRRTEEEGKILMLTKENKDLKRENRSLDIVVKQIEKFMDSLEIPSQFDDDSPLLVSERIRIMQDKWKRIITLNEKQ